MKKRILAIAMSIMTTMMIITGCGSEGPKDNGVVAKLDESVKAEDLLSSESMKSFSEMKELKDFIGVCKVNINLDVKMETEDETSDIKADLGLTFAHDGKIVHTITEADADVMGQETNEKIEMWYDSESEIQYTQENDTWVKYTDEDFESVMSEFTGFESMSSEFDIEEILKEFKLELDNTNGVYILKYEAGIKDLINKLPEEMLEDMDADMDIDALIEELNIPEDFKLTCEIIFNADKTLKGMEVSLSKAELDLSELVGTTAKITINSVKLGVSYSDIEALTIPEDIVKNAQEPQYDGFFNEDDWSDIEWDEEDFEDDTELELELEVEPY